MTRLAKDVTWLARMGAFWSVSPAFMLGFGWAGIIYGESHLLWSLAFGGLAWWFWQQSVGAFRNMYFNGRFDGAATAWAEATEECEAHHYCRICGGPHE